MLQSLSIISNTHQKVYLKQHKDERTHTHKYRSRQVHGKEFGKAAFTLKNSTQTNEGKIHQYIAVNFVINTRYVFV